MWLEGKLNLELESKSLDFSVTKLACFRGGVSIRERRFGDDVRGSARCVTRSLRNSVEKGESYKLADIL